MESSQVLVSIIVPVYNVEKYLEKTLSSIANQSFKKFEVIIVNDGSTDESEEIIIKFIEQYKDLEIKYYCQKNKGQSAARNKGISAADGEYIYFFDSDDLIDVNTIGLLYKNAKKYDLDLLLFSGESFYETEDAQTMKYAFNYKKEAEYPDVLSGEELFIELINNNDYSTSPCLYLVRKNVLLDNNLKFFEGIIHEDALFTFQLILSVNRSKVIKDILFFRRVHLNSTMIARNHTRSFLGNFTVLKEMINFQKKYNLTNIELSNAIHNRLVDAFGNTANQYIYINKNNKEKFTNELIQLKNIGKKYNHFNRIDYWLFNKQIYLYTLFRKTFDYLKQRKGKK